MPNRILRDCTDSEKVNSLSGLAERFFYRLFMKADDYGCFYADIRLLKANLFPLQLDKIRDAEITRWMAECQKSGLITVYDVAGKRYLEILNFDQRLRLKNRKFPCQSNDGQMTVKCPPEVETKLKQETKLETEVEGSGGQAASRPHLFKNSEFFDFEIFEQEMSMAEKYHLFDLRYYHESLINWSANGNKKTDWIATAKSWMLKDLREKKAALKPEHQSKMIPITKGKAYDLHDREISAAIAEGVAKHGPGFLDNQI